METAIAHGGRACGPSLSAALTLERQTVSITEERREGVADEGGDANKEREQRESKVNVANLGTKWCH